jgi:hypothetical protein
VAEAAKQRNKNSGTINTTIMKNKILLTLSLATLVASATQASQEQLANSIKEARLETARTSDQLKATLAAITGLTKQTKGDLRPAYTTYCAEVTKTDSAAAVTRKRAQWMSGDGRKYFQDWQSTIGSIANESLRKKSQKRLDAVKLSYDKVETSLLQAGEKFSPFLSDLSDIQKALAADVTAGGVKALKSTVRSANWNHQFVDNAIKSSLKEMDKMAKALSSEAK